jgi:glycosyltransferase involved in cell wall biosynthesis
MISIVTGTLNRLELLKKVVENTVYSNENIELVLVDGGSTDGTIDYIKSLENKRINLIELGCRSYYWDYMNIGIKNSKFDYICQWNDDILLENDWVDVIDELSGNYDMYLFSWLENESKYVIYDSEDQSTYPYDYLVLNYGIYNKKIFKEIGMYNNSYKYYYCDGDMSFRAKSFGYNYKKLFNIKCKPLTSHFQKIAFVENDKLELENYYFCLNQYKNKILLDNIEFLKN